MRTINVYKDKGAYHCFYSEDGKSYVQQTKQLKECIAFARRFRSGLFSVSILIPEHLTSNKGVEALTDEEFIEILDGLEGK